MNQSNTITVKTVVAAPIDQVWEAWTRPEHIVKWAFASDDWEVPQAENDIRTGGKFKTVMAAKDKSESFEFTGTYTNVQKPNLIEYDMDDGRHVKIEFAKTSEGIAITETLDPESENSPDVQRAGWQTILDNFRAYAESN